MVFHLLPKKGRLGKATSPRASKFSDRGGQLQRRSLLPANAVLCLSYRLSHRSPELPTRLETLSIVACSILTEDLTLRVRIDHDAVSADRKSLRNFQKETQGSRNISITRLVSAIDPKVTNRCPQSLSMQSTYYISTQSPLPSPPSRNPTPHQRL